MASKFAKKYKGYHGCCVIDTDKKRLKALEMFSVEDIWGIGRKLGKRMIGSHILTAYDFTRLNRQRVQREMGISGVCTWMELQGTSCIALEPEIQKKTITTSRSFKQELTKYDDLRAIVADFAALCAQKLRKQRSSAFEVAVYFRTNRFRDDMAQYSNAATAVLDVPDARELVKAAVTVLQSIFREGYGYKQAGVVVSHIVNGAVPTTLFDPVDRSRQEAFLKSLDAIRSKHGNRAVRVASQDDSSGAANRKYASPCFTTNIDDIIKVNVK